MSNSLRTLDDIISVLEQAIEIDDIERAKVMVIASKHAIQAHALKFAMKANKFIAYEKDTKLQKLPKVQ